MFSMSDYFGIRTESIPLIPRETIQIEEFDWKILLNPLLKKSLEIGFTISNELNYRDKEILITKHTSSSIPDEWIPFSALFRSNIFFYDSKESYLLIIVPSFLPRNYKRTDVLISELLRIAPIITKDKNMILWIIDDLNLLNERNILRNYFYLAAISEGLKNKFSLIISKRDMVIPLVDFLFSII